MDPTALLKIIKKDFRQTKPWAEFIEYKGYKTKILQNGSFLHEFTLGPISIIKSFRPELTEESLKEIQGIADRKANLICKLSPNYDFDITLKEKFKYEGINSTMSPSRTCIRDLTEDYDKIFNSFSENTRYKINRSVRERDKIEIIHQPTSQQINNFYDYVQKRQAFKKFISFQRDEVLKLNQFFNKDSHIITAYDKDGRVVVSNMYFTYDEKVTYFMGSLNSENHKSKAGYQLIHEALQYFKKLGIKVYDFEGISDARDPENYKAWEGYSNFKMKFGNQMFEYPLTIIRYNNLIFKGMVRIFGIN